VLFGISLWLAAERSITRDDLVRRLFRCPLALRWAVYYTMLVVLMLGASGQTEFIYFRF
jgi:hypothetical protein